MRTNTPAEAPVLIGGKHANAENIIYLLFREMRIYGFLYFKDSLKTGERFPSGGDDAEDLVFPQARWLQSHPEALASRDNLSDYLVHIRGCSHTIWSPIQL